MKTEKVNIDGVIYELKSSITDTPKYTAKVINILPPKKIQQRISIPEEIVFKNRIYEVKEIGQGAFRHSGAQFIDLPDDIIIRSNAFESCSKLEYLDLSQFTIIPSELLNHCTSLKSVKLSPMLTEIHSFAFNNCSALTDIQLPSSVKYIGHQAFSYSGISKLKIPESCIIKERICLGCNNLVEVTLPDDMRRIPDSMFNLCVRLESITIPDNVTSIGDWAFEDCYALHKVQLPKSLETIGKNIFRACPALHKVNISVNSLSTEILEYLDSEKITVNEWDPTVVISSWSDLIN